MIDQESSLARSCGTIANLMPNPSYSAGARPDHLELRRAIAAAEAGGNVIRAGFGQAHRVSIKSDSSPVTAIDLEAERVICASLRGAFPDDGFFGEESGRSDGPSGRLWVIDPLDGTKNFLKQLPFVSTQVALWERDTFVVGASCAPMFDDTIGAAAGAGAWRGNARLTVSDVNELAHASLSFGNVKTLARSARDWANVGALISRAARTRGYGDFFHYHALAAGQLDVVIESDVSIYDVAALSVIVTEAGGKVTDLAGKPLALDSTTIVATNGRLHDAVLAALSA
jgi:histidinol-phosphatase